ncbi:MAG: fused MFS/spermidine synthase [Pirellulales bacterium]|nr:fused MFS/spermidine synthase [Pirellulales bacterium]
MPTSPFQASRWPLPCLLAAAALSVLAPVASGLGQAVPPPLDASAGRLEYDGHSDYSHIRIRRNGQLRSMLFVRDGGQEVLESQVDLRRPYLLQFEYLRFMFTSYLVQPHQQDVLIVGLGGGGMIHFLRRLDPAVRIDAVEIDPLVVQLAGKYFDVRSEGTTRLITADAFKYIAESEKQYDAIYLDAFLKPSADTDGTGAPLALRTQQFYQQLQRRLKPGGVVAFNLNPHADIDGDIRGIAAAFPQTYVFPLSRFGGAVALASSEQQRLQPAELTARGAELDRRFRSTLRFQELARRVQR